MHTIANPLTAWFAVALGRDGLENILDILPSILGAARHDGRTVTSTFLAAGDTSADKAEPLFGKISGTAVRIGIVGVASINDDVSLFDTSWTLSL
jgi:hypothetical protein